MERDCCFGADPAMAELLANLQPLKTPQPQPIQPTVKKKMPVVRVVCHG